MMNGRSGSRRWFSRPQPAGTEPRKARSLYRTRMLLAAFGLLITGGTAIALGAGFADDGGSATLGAAAFFTLIALLALVNLVVVSLRWRGTRGGTS